MEAWAAETAHHAADAGAFYTRPEFWVAVGFFLFVAAVAKIVYRVVTVALDERANRIKQRIDEATKLAEDAQQLLATYERKQREATDESEAIVANARRQADRLRAEAEAELAQSVDRREKLAMERIAQAEASAIAEVRATAVDAAMQAVRTVLRDQLPARTADALIDGSIKELPARLH